MGDWNGAISPFYDFFFNVSEKKKISLKLAMTKK